MAIETTEQIVRESPDIEAYKLGLLKSAKALADKGVQIPRQMVADMSAMQIGAIDLAKAGMQSYAPYLQQSGYTMGDAQSAIGGAMAGALPFQSAAENLMRSGAEGVPGQVSAAQLNLNNAVAGGQQATDTAASGLSAAALGSQQIASQSVADQLAAYDRIPGIADAGRQDMVAAAQQGANVAAGSVQGGQGIMSVLNPQLDAATANASRH
jgi:hypothetical protein